MLAIAGPLLFLALLISPRLIDELSRRFEDNVAVRARIIACESRRLGTAHENAILCRFRYTFGGKIHETEAPSWTSRSPFITSDGIARVTAMQSAATHRIAYLHRDDPSRAWLADRRLLAMPPLWVWLTALFVALGIAGFRLDPTSMPWRRAELVTDPATGHLIAIDNRHRNRVRRRILLQTMIAMAMIAMCLFGLSNRLAEHAGRLGMAGLQPTPARLVDCAHRYHGVRRGNDRIECGFEYRAGGQLRRGEAESLDYRLFPTRARMDAEIAGLARNSTVTAYFDPRQPTYAWAAIRTDLMVPFTWGLFDLQLWVIVIALAGFTVMSAFRWKGAGEER